MDKTEKSSEALKLLLQTHCKQLLDYMQKGEYPPAESCEETRLLLLEYVKTLSWPVPDFAEQHKIRVSFLDKPGEKATTEEVLSELKRNPTMLDILYRLGLRKILDGGDPCILLPEWQLLLEQGYLADVDITGPEGKRKYYTLSSKGWSCFNRKNFQKNLKKQAADHFRAIPDKMMLHPEDWNALNFIRAAMLEQFYADSAEGYLAFLYPDAQGLLLGSGINDKVSVSYGCPAIFDGQPSENQIAQMRELIDADKVDDITFLLRSAADQSILQGILNQEETEKVHFCIMEATNGSEI